MNSTLPESCSERQRSSRPSIDPPFGGLISIVDAKRPSRSAAAKRLSSRRADAARAARALAREDRLGDRPFLPQRVADRGDLDRRRAAAAADDSRAEVARLRGEVAEVLVVGVRVDDPVAPAARKAEIRQGGERQPRSHRGERREGGLWAGAVVRAARCDAELAHPRSCLRRSDTAGGLAVRVEGHERDDRQARDAAHGRDRGRQLLQLVEGLHHEEVDAARVERLRLLCVDGGAVDDDRAFAERADRAGDQHVRARHLARLARELDAFAVDPRDVVVEEPCRELRAVRPERVRLDQLGARLDVADVYRHDDLGRDEVRLLGCAQPARRSARDQRAHAPVGDDRRPRREAVEEPAHRSPVYGRQ